jgi:hypothetical protein
MQLDEWIGLACCLGFFGGFLGLISVILRKVMGVTWSLDVDPGPPLRKSWWGDAGVNSVSCRGMAQVVEYEQGWLIRVLPTFVFGVLWMPKKETEVGPLEPGGWFIASRRRLDYRSDTVILCGHLADFVTSPAETTMKNERSADT